MAGASVKFGMRDPVVFREHGCDGEFFARVTGSAEISDYDAGRCGEGETAEAALRKTIVELIPGCLARWPEGKLVMGSGNREVLNGLLEAALADTGVTAKVEVRSIDLIEGQMDAYMKACGEALRESMFPSVRTDDLEDEPHGPLIGISYDSHSHGMMMGSSSSGGDRLDWNRDGSIILTSSYSGDGKSIQTEYRVRPEVAERVRDYVAEKHLAALSKKKIPTPMVCDNFTSTSIVMTFDDSALGGSSFETLSIRCGPAGMTFRKIEQEISGLLKACQESGECTQHEEKETGGAFGGFPGPMGFGMLPNLQPMAADAWSCPQCGRAGNTGAFCMGCGSPRPAAGGAGAPAAAPVPAKQEDAAAEPRPGGWTCSSCGHGGNGGRFCAWCGSPR